MEMSVAGARISIISFVFAGINIFGSGFFTSLNNGLISALVSFLRTLVFQIVTILVLPLIFGLKGIWFSMVIADVLACITTIIFLIKFRKKI